MRRIDRPASGPSATCLVNRVLVVENSRFFANVVVKAIETRLGLPAIAVSSLSEAQTLLDAGEEFFLALTGLVLPDAAGEAVVGFFSSRSLPVVVLTGVDDDATRERLSASGVVDYVLKGSPGAADYIVWVVRRLERNRTIAALVVDDSRTIRQQIGALLRLCGFRVVEAADGSEALGAIATDPAIRLMVTDHEMPGMDGVELTRAVRAQRGSEDLAIVAVSGTGKPGLVARFLKNGANDFLHKPFSREEFFCRVQQNIDNLDLLSSLRDMATKDFLTGLSNRRHFFDRATPLVAEAMGGKRRLATAMMDIDFFKKINDTRGHDGGDAALRAVAATVGAHARCGDLVARFGGEEFCLLALDLGDDEVDAFFERLRAAVAALPIHFAGETFGATISIGVCVGPRDGGIDQVLAEADRMLYRAKSSGRNRVEISQA
ncbi:MAG: diguanylate cyclase [Pseudomonadota bacterium]